MLESFDSLIKDWIVLGRRRICVEFVRFLVIELGDEDILGRRDSILKD